MNLCFDPELFEQNIQEAFENTVVGYGYSINVDGNANVHSGGGGSAITAASNGGTSVPYTANTEMTVASVAKTITATALLHLLDAENISVDSAISPFLPPLWFQGPNIARLPPVTPELLFVTC